MFYLRLLLTAARSLEANFMRSLLATVGVMIGVSSVVACMSILEGAQSRIASNVKSLGSNMLYIVPAVARIEGRPVGFAQTLTLSDIDRLLREHGSEIDGVAPEASASALVKRFQASEDYAIVATNEKYFEINSFEAERGRVISKADAEDDNAAVAVIGHKVAERIFGGADAVGEAISIGGAAYRVVGVLEKRGTLGFVNADETVYIPIRTGLTRFLNRNWLTRLSVQGADPQKLSELQKKVRQTLRQEHRIRAGQPDDFQIFTQEETLQQFNQVVTIFRIVFYSIAGISLVVGGIGIMNIMLVSVTERTREIGVRIAVGARRGDILLQFLAEALTISLLGGGLGVLLGVMFADLVEKVFVNLFETEVTSTVVIVAFLTSTLTGVISGIYPAFKASRQDPVDALRYE
ncbi:MAG: ABC transporter permease [Planctomycetia bacterium]|nr:MAG: ABC transporter permease [Planctomycetia bacterium]